LSKALSDKELEIKHRMIRNIQENKAYLNETEITKSVLEFHPNENEEIGTPNILINNNEFKKKEKKKSSNG
jgi:hypothetical protein